MAADLPLADITAVPRAVQQEGSSADGVYGYITRPRHEAVSNATMKSHATQPARSQTQQNPLSPRGFNGGPNWT